MRSIAIMNRKSVGKTTTAVNAGALAATGSGLIDPTHTAHARCISALSRASKVPRSTMC